MATCEQTHSSPSGTIAEQSTHKVEFLANGYTNPIAACYAAWLASPEIIGGMWRHHMDYEPYEKTDNKWTVTVVYNREGTKETADNPTGSTPFEPELSFDTTGEKTKIFATASGTYTQHNNTTFGTPWAPNFNGAIGVSGKNIEGVEITIPSLKWEETHEFESKEITGDFVNALFLATGRTNEDDWRIFQAGEVLFLGAKGKRSRNQKAQITFSFAASPNVEDGTFYGIEHIDKEGWQYLWPYVQESEDEDSKAVIPTVLAVYVHTVYPKAAFDDLPMPEDAFEGY